MYCPLPFNHTAISTDGFYNVCCINPTPKSDRFHLNDGDFDEWQKNRYCKEVKQSFLDQQQHPGCGQCWKIENLGGTSYRQRILKEYKILGAKEGHEKLLNIEIAVGNLCNLSCLMCKESDSSAILAENIKLKINQVSQADFKWNESNFVNLSKNLKLKPKLINLRGGEPLFNKKIFEILDSFNAEDVKDTIIHITTNGTIWNQQWASMLSKFKLVRLMFSIDATGSLYNYIRYPGNFDNVEQNLKEIISCKNIKPLIHATVQNLNILHLGELINWANRFGVHLELDQVVEPDFLHFTNLPVDLKIKSINYLKDLLTLSLDAHIKKELDSYLQTLEQTIGVSNLDLWNKFIANISQRDNLRGNSYKDFLR
jgi:MoaA/NifB/PqqE/SkfB family radical SAM enzyme